MQQAALRDDFGQFLPGTAPGPGKPKGRKSAAPAQAKRAPRAPIVDRARQIQDLLEPQVPAILAELGRAAAGGDVQAARIALSYVASPASPKTRVDLPGLDQLAPELRIGAITQATARGEIAVETAQALIGMAKAEIEASVVAPIRAALQAIAAGGDLKAIARHLGDVVRVVDSLEHNPTPADKAGTQQSTAPEGAAQEADQAD